MFWNAWCMRKVVGAHAWFQRHVHNPKFDYNAGPTSNGHNAFILNQNYSKFVFKLKPRMSSFQ